jgi:hypothetical protein
LEIVSLHVLTKNVGNFTFFIVGSKRWNCPARCKSAANVILKDIIAAAAAAPVVVVIVIDIVVIVVVVVVVLV